MTVFFYGIAVASTGFRVDLTVYVVFAFSLFAGSLDRTTMETATSSVHQRLLLACAGSTSATLLGLVAMAELLASSQVKLLLFVLSTSLVIVFGILILFSSILFSSIFYELLNFFF